MTRHELEMLAAPLVERTFAVCQEALSIAHQPVTSFDKIILVGGSTRVALVRRRVEQFFGTPPLDRVNPEEVVAIGAAIQAAALTEAARRRSIPPPPVPAIRKSLASLTSALSGDEEDITLATQVPAQIAALQRLRPAATTEPLVAPTHEARSPSAPAREARSPSAPAREARSPSAPAREARPPTALTPEVPSPGDGVLETGTPFPSQLPSQPDPPRGSIPALPAVSEQPPEPQGTLSIPSIPPVLVDVTPRALVVETVGGWCDVVVQRNAKIPCERTRAFATSADGQTNVLVRVAQGEEPHFGSNTYLGQVELSGLRPAPRGTVTIQVRFELDESGTLQVFATDVATGREAHALLHLVGIAGAESVASMRARHATAEVR
jgi:molecular chaperone DnaK